VVNIAFYDFCGFRSVAVNTVYKLQFFHIYLIITIILIIGLDSSYRYARVDGVVHNATVYHSIARCYSVGPVGRSANSYLISLIILAFNHIPMENDKIVAIITPHQ